VALHRFRRFPQAGTRGTKAVLEVAVQAGQQGKELHLFLFGGRRGAAAAAGQQVGPQGRGNGGQRRRFVLAGLGWRPLLGGRCCGGRYDFGTGCCLDNLLGGHPGGGGRPGGSRG